MRRALLIPLILAATMAPLSAATVSRTYSYFSIGGLMLPEIERQLQTRGPSLPGSGQRHPGATNMEFATRVDYAQSGGRCRIADARVSVKAQVILPRWRDRQRAEGEVRLIWDTLSRDIKRHEEGHLVIARNYARQLEDELKALPRNRSCEALAARAEATSARVMAEHDAAQEQFDRIEAINFESRIMRLLRYRLEQIETGVIEHP